MKKGNDFQFWLTIVALMLVMIALTVVRANAVPLQNELVYEDVPFTGDIQKDLDSASLKCLECLSERKFDKARLIGFLIDYKLGILRVYYEGIVEKEVSWKSNSS